MTVQRPPEELWELLERNVSGWPHHQLRQHGFDLLFGEPERLAKERRAHARRVLVAQHALADQVEHHQSPVVVMKGLEVAMLYPRPIERPFRDLDILVRDARPRWDRLVSLDHRKNPKRAIDIDHHHLPALEHPTGVLGIELHHSPNLPGWAKIPNDLIFDTAQPSRTGIEGALRPRDDIHALLLALHCWVGGFARWRDLLDARILASAADEPTAETAASFGLGRFWEVSTRLADSLVFGIAGRAVPLQRYFVPTEARPIPRRRAVILSPFTAAHPARVIRSHLGLIRAQRR